MKNSLKHILRNEPTSIYKLERHKLGLSQLKQSQMLALQLHFSICAKKIMYLGGITKSSDIHKLYSFGTFIFLAVWCEFGLYDFPLRRNLCESQSITPGCRDTGSSTNVSPTPALAPSGVCLDGSAWTVTCHIWQHLGTSYPVLPALLLALADSVHSALLSWSWVIPGELQLAVWFAK